MTTVDRTATAADRFPDAPLLHYARRISWGAIFAGMVMAVVIQLLLGLVGTGIGLSTLDPLRYASPDAASLGMGAGIWWVVSSIIALFAGGWVAGHLAGSPEQTDAVLHGLLTWGIATMVTVYLIASLVGSALRGGAAVVGKTADMAAVGVSAAAGPAATLAKDELAANGITMDSLKAQAKELLVQTGKPALQADSVAAQASAAAGQIGSGVANAGATGNEPAADLQSTLQKIIAGGKATIDQADRTAVVNVVMARTGVTREQAEQRADAWIKQYQDTRVAFEKRKAEAELKARQVADDTASATSKGALGAAVALLLGAVAAALGGMVARRRVVVTAPVSRNVGGYSTASR